MRVSGVPKILLLQSYKIIFISPNFAWLKLAKIHQETALKLLKILNLGNCILFDPINEIVFPKKPYSMFPRPCRGGDRGGVSDIKEDRRAWKILCAGKNADPTPAPPLQGRGVNSKGSNSI